MRRRKTRTRRLELAAALAAALGLSACGGAGKTAPPPLPSISHSLASALAGQSDGVAAALAAGNSCRALRLAQELQQRTIAAINRGQVAVGLQEQLSAAVNELVASVHCVPAAPAAAPRPRPSEKEHGHGKHGQKHENDKKHGEGD